MHPCSVGCPTCAAQAKRKKTANTKPAGVDGGVERSGGGGGDVTAVPRCAVRRVDHVEASISGEDLLEKYIKLNRPVVIKKGLLDDWEARNEWTLDNLVAKHGGLVLQVAKGPQPKDASFILSAEDKAEVGQFEEWLAMQAKEGWIFDPKDRFLKRGKERSEYPVDPPPGYKKRVMRAGTKNMTLAKYVSSVMRGSGNGGGAGQNGTDMRYVFNTLTHKGTSNGTHGSLWEDFDVPEPIADAYDAIESEADSEPAAAGTAADKGEEAGFAGEDITTLPGTFEFFLGPAGSGAHPHVHAAAWNGLVFGSKRWLLWPPGLLQDSKVNVSMPAIEFFTAGLPDLIKSAGNEVYEFTQREGEVVFIPDSWGHAVLNLEPCIGVSRQLNAYAFDDPKDIDLAARSFSSVVALDIGIGEE